MKKYEHLRKKAIKWRQDKGMTIDQIGKRLSLSRTTVYHWIKGVPIDRTNRQTKAQQCATKALVAKHKALRDGYYQAALNEVTSLMRRATFRDFVVIYLTEGFRRTQHMVSVVNSNAQIVKLSDRWIRELSGKEPTYSLQCHVDNDEMEVKKHWATKLKIKPSVIKTYRKSNSGALTGRNWRSEFGLLTVRVCSTELRTKLEAWMDWVQRQWN